MKNRLTISLFLFGILNIVYYLVLYFGSNLIPFNRQNYYFGAHHYYFDQRTSGGPHSFLRSLGAWDAQWYLKIASNGYPRNPTLSDIKDKTIMDGLTYAFFPIYPAVLKTLNVIFGNLEVTAFILSNVMMFANFISLYFLLKKYFGENVALKANFLLWTFPFGVIFRSYYTENLFLFFLIWFVYFLFSKKFLLAAIVLGMMNITRGSAFVLYFLYGYFLIRNKKILPLFISLLPLVLWMVYCFSQTGNPLYFISVRTGWGGYPLFPFLTLIYPFLSGSPDGLFVMIFQILIYWVAKFIPQKFTAVSLSLLIPPVIFFMFPFARSQIISFPLLIYPAMRLNRIGYIVVVSVQFFLLCLLGLHFINWNWIG